MYSSYELFQGSPEGYFGVHFPSCWNKHQNNTKMSAETVRCESTYIILFLTRHDKSINNNKTTTFTHRPRVSLARFSFCWWRHNRLLMTSQWPDNYDAITWIVVSNSLDINFIRGDIHGRPCRIPMPFWPNVKCCISHTAGSVTNGIRMGSFTNGIRNRDIIPWPCLPHAL